jgi:hypothetical protein
MTDVVTRSNVTESPWFWLMLFSAAALVGVTTIAPKYAVREARRERMAEARETIAAARAAGVQAHDVRRTDAEDDDDAADAPPIVPYMYEDFQKSPKLGWLSGSLIALTLVGAAGVYVTRFRSFRATSSAA